MHTLYVQGYVLCAYTYTAFLRREIILLHLLNAIFSGKGRFLKNSEKQILGAVGERKRRGSGRVPLKKKN